MKKAMGILVLAAVVLGLVALESTVGQEGDRGAKEEGPTGSGIKAFVVQTEGEKNEVENAHFQKEQLGLLSLTKVPTHTYTLHRGKAVITVPLRKIKKMIFTGDTVRVIGIAGKELEGQVVKNTRYFLFGNVRFGEFELDLHDAQSVEFVHPKAKQFLCRTCNRLYVNPEWRFCPYDGARLIEVE